MLITMSLRKFKAVLLYVILYVLANKYKADLLYVICLLFYLVYFYESLNIEF